MDMGLIPLDTAKIDNVLKCVTPLPNVELQALLIDLGVYRSLLYPISFGTMKSSKFFDFGAHATVSHEPFNVLDVGFVPLDTASMCL